MFCVTSAGTVGANVTVDVQTMPCTTAVVITPDEYQAFTEVPTLTQIFEVPDVSVLQDVWLIGFSLPMVIYLSAWALQSVVGFINSKAN